MLNVVWTQEAAEERRLIKTIFNFWFTFKNN